MDTLIGPSVLLSSNTTPNWCPRQFFKLWSPSQALLNPATVPGPSQYPWLLFPLAHFLNKIWTLVKYLFHIFIYRDEYGWRSTYNHKFQAGSQYHQAFILYFCSLFSNSSERLFHPSLSTHLQYLHLLYAFTPNLWLCHISLRK